MRPSSFAVLVGSILVFGPLILAVALTIQCNATEGGLCGDLLGAVEDGWVLLGLAVLGGVIGVGGFMFFGAREGKRRERGESGDEDPPESP